ncbi:MAG: hypothetical protein B6I20_05555 [Bacteroidetes bacterium 4572_117]|nr:MAG: hypothetical protein B6I20_05555 [Bacteroidetes bacterium 4572_117]
MEFDLTDLYAKTFGYVAMPYPLGNLSLPDFKGRANNLADALVGKTLLGNTVWMPVVIDNQWLPNTFMNITAQKHIVKTAVTGRSGTVKEIVNIQDYKIQIRGFIIDNETNGYPVDEVEKLHALFEKDISLPIVNNLCEILGINMVVLEALKVPEQIYQNVQAYELTMVSDDDFDVIVK